MEHIHLLAFLIVTIDIDGNKSFGFIIYVELILLLEDKQSWEGRTVMPQI